MLTAYTDAILDLRQRILSEGYAKSQSNSGSPLRHKVSTFSQHTDLDPLPSLVGDTKVARDGTQLVRAGTIAAVARGGSGQIAISSACQRHPKYNHGS